MAVDLSGKRALVTGAGRGIGAGCAVELARSGADVVVNDRELTDAARETLSARLLSIDPAVMTPDQVITPATALQLGWLGLADILVFFCVLLVGFAYVWKRGDLDWIRALTKKSAQASDQSLAGVG